MSRLNVTASSLVYSSTLRDLYLRIGESGWSVKKVKFDKKEDHYVATAKNDFGEEIEKTGPDEQMAVRNLVLAIERKNHMRTAAMERIGMWKADWSDQLQPIAEAYAKAPVYDPKAAAAYKALADDSMRRAEVLRNQLHVEEVNNPEPYPHAQAMADDIHKRQHFLVSTANSEHPLWTPEQNTAFRIVHDVLGHGVSGGDFGWEGENKACAAHFPLLSAEAQKALFSECIAQTAYGAHYRHFGPQKVALFPQFYEPAQKAEGVHPNFQGIHPSQSVAPTAMPAIKPSKPVGLPKDNVAPHEQEAQGAPVSMNYVPGVDIGKTGAVLPGQDVDPTLGDPNAGYQTGIPAMEPNAYLHHGDPLQAQDTIHNASLIDTEWAKLKTGENKPDYERMKLAIVNAFRAVLLSPRKDLRWNTIHYQDISGVPPGVTDPTVYWHALENKRQAWNVKNFGENARFSHRPYFKLLPQFERVVYDRNPQAGWEVAKERAQHELFDWEQEEQERIMEADEKLPEENRMNHFEIEKEANKALTKKLEVFLAEHKAYDQPNLFTASQRTSIIQPTQERLPGEVQATFTVDPTTRSLGIEEWSSLVRGQGNTATALTALRQRYPGYRIVVFDATTLGAEDYWKVMRSKGLVDEITDDWGERISAAKEPTKEDTLFPLEPQVKQQKFDRYGAFMGTHLKAIAQISTHVDALLKAALEDVHEHDGSGHHFRAAVLQLGVSGAGPKVASFAWLLLQPTTSQLATIDTHIMDVLGHNYDKEMNTRDYFKYERELQAGRDAAGYEHVPLGAFQWGMWDNKRTGEGSHQDHSGLRVLDPVPHESIDWQTKEQNLKNDAWQAHAPDWWKNTEPARKQVGEEWDETINAPKTQVPFQAVASVFKTSAILRTPWIVHPQSGERLEGQPGQTLMAHAVNTLHLSTPEIWAQVTEAGKA